MQVLRLALTFIASAQRCNHLYIKYKHTKKYTWIYKPFWNKPHVTDVIVIETVWDHLDRTQENATNIQKPLGSLENYSWRLL